MRRNDRAIGSAVDPGRVGQRVLVRTMQDPRDADTAMSTVTFGSEMDGAFAQFALARSAEVFAIESNLTDVELASFPCAYSTAEGLLHRSEVGEKIEFSSRARRAVSDPRRFSWPDVAAPM